MKHLSISSTNDIFWDNLLREDWSDICITDDDRSYRGHIKATSEVAQVYIVLGCKTN